MSYYAKILLIAAWALLVTGLGNAAWANVILDGTRVIYPAGKKEVTVKLTSQNTRPVLVQSWIDNGDKNKAASLNVPFVLTPPINRIDGGKGQTLRISYLGTPALPQDRESMFWLNVLEVPAKAQEEANISKLSLAFNTRVKLFYRPENLPGTASEAMENLHWAMKGNGVNVTNPSKYYVSLASIEFKSGGKAMAVKARQIAPGTTEFFEIRDNSVTSVNQLSYTAVNDFGGFIKLKAKP